MELNKEAKDRALLELASTDGWRIVADMLAYDVKFASSLLGKPKPGIKGPDGKYIEEPKWIYDPHEIGRARGILGTATKYLDMINNVKGRNSKGE
jgi:hypothetical protein